MKSCRCIRGTRSMSQTVYAVGQGAPLCAKMCKNVQNHDLDVLITKGSLCYLSSIYFSTSVVLGEVVGPFLEIDGWK